METDKKEEIENDAASSDADNGSQHHLIVFGEFQKRMIDTLKSELQHISHVVEDNMANISGQFDHLAHHAETQRNSYSDAVKSTEHVEIDDEQLPMEEVVRRLNQIIEDKLISVLTMSGKLQGNLKEFDDIADNINKLVGNNDALSSAERNKMKSFAMGIIRNTDELRHKYAVPPSDQEKIRQQVHNMVQALVHKNNHNLEALSEIRDSSLQMSDTINKIIVLMQFQDITKQRIDHILNAMEVMKSGISDLHGDISETLDPEQLKNIMPKELVDQLIEGCTLSDIKEKYLKGIMGEDHHSHDAADNSSSDKSDEDDAFLF